MVKLHKSIYPIILTDEDETKDDIGRYRKSICHGSTSVHDFFFLKKISSQGDDSVGKGSDCTSPGV